MVKFIEGNGIQGTGKAKEHASMQMGIFSEETGSEVKDMGKDVWKIINLEQLDSGKGKKFRDKP